MDESWHEEVSMLKEKEWKFPPEPIKDPKELLRIFIAFEEQTVKRLDRANVDLRALEKVRDGHVTSFQNLSKEERDQAYERSVLRRDGRAIEDQMAYIEDVQHDIEDWRERIERLRKEVAELEQKEAEELALKRAKRRPVSDEPERKRKKTLSETEAAKVREIADKLKDVGSMTALRTLINECADLAKGEEEGEKEEAPHDESDLSLEDLPDGADVRGVSILEDIATYSEAEKDKLLLSKYP